MKNRFTLIVAAFLLAAFLTGACSRGSIDYKYRTLASTYAVEKVYDNEFIISFGSIRINESLERPEIIEKMEESQIIFSSDEEWVGNLSGIMQTVIADYLNRSFPNSHVLETRNIYLGKVNYKIHFNFRRFNVNAKDEFEAFVFWHVLDMEKNEITLKGNFSRLEKLESKNTDAIISASEKVLFELSVEIASKLHEVN